MASSGMLRRVAVVRTDISEERSASIITVTRIGELGTSLKNGVFWVVTPCGSCKNRTQKTPFFIVTAVKTSNLT
jgi:hypothetical protein